jgi:hypothetical protein
MIIYVASYPRSGNSWIKILILWHFQRITSDIYRAKKPFKHEQWHLRAVTKAPSTHQQDILWNNWTALYEPPLTPQSTHRCLLPGCKKMLTETHRKQLAWEEEHFFLKTHELPFPHYFEGEYVIQPVRNAGAVLWSYYNFIRDFQPWYRRRSLTEVIKGKALFGSWNNYHLHWAQAAAKLKGRYLQIHYERLGDHQSEVCYQIEQFTGLKYFQRESIPFQRFKDRNPTMYREGTMSGWEQYYSKEQLHLLWQMHEEAMQYLGYCEPDYEKGLEKTIY